MKRVLAAAAALVVAGVSFAWTIDNSTPLMSTWNPGNNPKPTITVQVRQDGSLSYLPEDTAYPGINAGVWFNTAGGCSGSLCTAPGASMDVAWEHDPADPQWALGQCFYAGGIPEYTWTYMGQPITSFAITGDVSTGTGDRTCLIKLRFRPTLGNPVPEYGVKMVNLYFHVTGQTPGYTGYLHMTPGSAVNPQYICAVYAGLNGQTYAVQTDGSWCDKRSGAASTTSNAFGVGQYYAPYGTPGFGTAYRITFTGDTNYLRLRPVSTGTNGCDTGVWKDPTNVGCYVDFINPSGQPAGDYVAHVTFDFKWLGPGTPIVTQKVFHITYHRN